MPRTLDFADFDPDEHGVTTAFNAAVQAVAEIGAAELYVDKRYPFLSKPNPITTPLRIVGKGWSRSALIRGYQPAHEDEPFIDAQTSYIDLEAIEIVPGDGTTGGRGLEIVLSTAPDQYGNWTKGEDIRLVPDIEGSGTGGFKYGVYLNGDDSPSAPSAAGLRDIPFDNCWIRCPCSAAHLYCKTVRQLRWSGYFDFGGKVIVTGGAYESQNVTLETIGAGIVEVERTQNLTLLGPWQHGWIKPDVHGYDIVKMRPEGQWIVESPHGVFRRPAADRSFTGPHALLESAGWSVLNAA